MNAPFSNVGTAIKTVMPTGTNPPKVMERDPQGQVEGGDCPQNWRVPPMFPPDMFAVASYLCKVGGVVPYLEPSPYATETGDGHFVLSRADRDSANKASIDWRNYEEAGFPTYVRYLWAQLSKHWTASLTPQPNVNEKIDPLGWWKPALLLTMISDMACSRVLKNKLEKEETEKGEDPHTLPESPFEDWIHTNYLLQELKALEQGEEFRPPASLTLLVDTTIVCVLPKMRVAPVGATLRNVSRNLSLLPGRGEVRCYWDNLNNNSLRSEDNETLDILLIPEPATFDATDFVPEHNGDKGSSDLRKNKWNWDNFQIEQTWIKGEAKREKFLINCRKLLETAQKETRCVNAIVLPEYAIDYALFDKLCDLLKTVEPRLEFVIAGSSDNCYGQHGNHVVTRLWDDQNDSSLSATKSRRKHHRWRMDRRQVETYGLSSVMNPKIPNWWENTPLGRRELYFHRFRKASAFSVLICEELARSDPCHDILRAVAPNLIFALLLDGPQIKQRWPAQYASNLADDPGSSVLTFTSYGLIDRSNRQGHFEPNHSVAMWKDDSGQFVEIPMPQGKGPRGILLSLWSEHVRDITLTGKRSDERAWRYSGHFPIVLEV